ncbi:MULTISPECIES: FMN-binding negative transcriptional regulator [unclassified Rhizobium]|uniref:FMN-binding negative transcriptional regulator n=1 Tax=unclassified Rhizobium TaxID=2613769 RepID=UPI0009E20DAA|nr:MULTISPECIES: FMN-binding negative transcriptional regulator [unclassified Rhizobium]MBD8687727.1 FMN-binding negative transcriptional regulator [Rhizobium sp. CFBP 13644]MBD8692181.1 FMN-binding negative transcriptional regulator [Rhizobium sp. CFBP 13717]
MHYSEYKHTDPALLRALVETFPFAAISINGPEGPRIAHAPLTFRPRNAPAGALEFHLAKANPISSDMTVGVPVTILVQGPGAAISPSWFTSSFPDPDSDRSRTAPTYNYISLIMHGRLAFMDDVALQRQIKDLVNASEPQGGWQTEELAADLWQGWRKLIQGYRLEITSFDLTAKLSHGDVPEDRRGVVEGLLQRGVLADENMAHLVGGHDGTSASLQSLIRSLKH